MTRDTAAAEVQEALLRRATAGEAQAARALTELLAPRAYAQAFRMLGQQAEAEDVVQDALMRLWRMAPNWDSGGGQVSTWLFRVVRNLCIDRMRRARSLSLDEDGAPEPPDDAPGAEARLQSRARTRALQGALRALPDRQRQAVVLRHIEGLSNPEIAATLEISVEAVESLTARGKRALRTALAGQRDALGFDDDTT